MSSRIIERYPEGISLFLSGQGVCKIILKDPSRERDEKVIKIAVTYPEFQKIDLNTHHPLLFRIARAYDCLDPPTNCSYQIFIRKMKTDDWHHWFSVEG